MPKSNDGFINSLVHSCFSDDSFAEVDSQLVQNRSDEQISINDLIIDDNDFQIDDGYGERPDVFSLINPDKNPTLQKPFKMMLGVIVKSDYYTFHQKSRKEDLVNVNYNSQFISSIFNQDMMDILPVPCLPGTFSVRLIDPSDPSCSIHGDEADEVRANQEGITHPSKYSQDNSVVIHNVPAANKFVYPSRRFVNGKKQLDKNMHSATGVMYTPGTVVLVGFFNNSYNSAIILGSTSDTANLYRINTFGLYNGRPGANKGDSGKVRTAVADIDASNFIYRKSLAVLLGQYHSDGKKPIFPGARIDYNDVEKQAILSMQQNPFSLFNLNASSALGGQAEGNSEKQTYKNKNLKASIIFGQKRNQESSQSALTEPQKTELQLDYLRSRASRAGMFSTSSFQINMGTPCFKKSKFDNFNDDIEKNGGKELFSNEAIDGLYQFSMHLNFNDDRGISCWRGTKYAYNDDSLKKLKFLSSLIPCSYTVSPYRVRLPHLPELTDEVYSDIKNRDDSGKPKLKSAIYGNDFKKNPRRSGLIIKLYSQAPNCDKGSSRCGIAFSTTPLWGMIPQGEEGKYDYGCGTNSSISFCSTSSINIIAYSGMSINVIPREDFKEEEIKKSGVYITAKKVEENKDSGTINVISDDKKIVSEYKRKLKEDPKPDKEIKSEVVLYANADDIVFMSGGDGKQKGDEKSILMNCPKADDIKVEKDNIVCADDRYVVEYTSKSAPFFMYSTTGLLFVKPYPQPPSPAIQSLPGKSIADYYKEGTGIKKEKVDPKDKNKGKTTNVKVNGKEVIISGQELKSPEVQKLFTPQNLFDFSQKNGYLTAGETGFSGAPTFQSISSKYALLINDGSAKTCFNGNYIALESSKLSPNVKPYDLSKCAQFVESGNKGKEGTKNSKVEKVENEEKRREQAIKEEQKRRADKTDEQIREIRKEGGFEQPKPKSEAVAEGKGSALDSEDPVVKPQDDFFEKGEPPKNSPNVANPASAKGKTTSSNSKNNIAKGKSKFVK